MAIMAIVTGLSFLTYASANRRQPSKTRDNFKNYTTYASQLVKAEDKDVCLAIVEYKDEYYGIMGLASGDSQAALISSFHSFKKIVQPSGNAAGKYEDEYPLSDFTSGSRAPTTAREFLSLGKRTQIDYTSVAGATTIVDASNPVIIKFRKFDGSVLAGAGEYKFSTPVSGDNDSTLILEESTGSLRLKK